MTTPVEIIRLCPRCQTRMVLKSDPSCPADLAESIADWCVCNPCAKKHEARITAIDHICRAAARFYDYNCRLAEYKTDKQDGLSTAVEPKQPGEGISRLLSDGVVWWDRYLKLSGLQILPNLDLRQMIAENPGEPVRVMFAYEEAARRKNQK